MTSFTSLWARIHVGGRDKRNMQGTLRQNFVFENKGMWNVHWRSRHFQRGLGIMHIRSFFSPDRLILRPGNICSAQNIIEIVRHSGANIHVILLNVVRKKFEIFLGDRFMCEIISSHKHSFTDDLQSITYYIIYTLTRIENVLIYVAHAFKCIVAEWN